MAVKPIRTEQGDSSRYEWLLTAADQEAEATPPMPARNEKSVDVRGASGAGGFNGAVVQCHGTLDVADTNFKLLSAVPDTFDLSFTQAAATIHPILPHVVRFKPVVSSGTLGVDGVTVVLIATSALPQVH